MVGETLTSLNVYCDDKQGSRQDTVKIKILILDDVSNLLRSL